jgi:hypothetical protein
MDNICNKIGAIFEDMKVDDKRTLTLDYYEIMKIYVSLRSVNFQQKLLEDTFMNSFNKV